MQQQRDLHYLFAVWRQQADLPVDLEAYGLRIRPLLCRDPDQQQQFLDVWAKHWGSSTAAKHETSPDAQTRQQAEHLIEQQRSGTPPAQQRRRTQIMQLGILLVLLTVLAGLIYWQFYRSAPVARIEPQPLPPIVQPDTLVKPKPRANDNGTYRPYLTEIPIRQLPPGFPVEGPLRIAGYWAATVSNVALLLPLLWLWQRRRVQFRRGKSPHAEDLRLRAPRASLAPLLGANAKSLFGRLRFAANGERRIDWRQTVSAIAQSGGAPQLIFRQRPRQADFVLIADRRHRDDQNAWLLTQLVDTLKQAQIRVHRYHFDRHPEWLWPDKQRGARPETLQQVLWLHPGSRVLLVAEHEVMFYRLTGEPQSWLQAFKAVPEYRLALTTRPHANQLDRLQLAHYRFTVIDKLSDLTPLLDFATHPPTADRADETFAMPTDFRREWLGTLPPVQLQPVLDWISHRYGGGVRRLLGFLAVYPALHGDLSRALFDYAAAESKGFTAESLLTTLGLPWCRQGWLPGWLRRALLAEMTRDDRRLARRFFLRLFSGKQPAGHIVQLQLQKQPAWWRVWPRFGGRRGELKSPWRDGIFAEILLLPRWHWLEQLLPRRLLAALPNMLISAWPRRFALVLLTLAYAAAVNALWQHYGKPWYARQLLAEHIAADRDVTVTIVHHPGGLAAAQALGHGLAAMGYRIARTPDNTVEVNRIDAPAPLLDELLDIAKHMTWGGDFELASETAAPLIYLAAMPRTGQVFRDPIPTARVPAAYPVQLDWQAAQDIKPLDRRAPDIDWSVQAIQPTMTPITAGKFRMGSPANEKGRYDNEGPQHDVNIPAFQLAEAELTFDEWERCVQAKACRAVEDNGWGRGKRPVINVSWDDAQSYIGWLNKRLDLSGPSAYRLPSEAEWEYAARAGTTTAYYWGQSWQCGYVNAGEFGQCKGVNQTQPVKNYKANAFKLYDVSGNVWEWVQDCWHDNYNGAPGDGRAWEQGACERRALRGGSWNNFPSLLRSASRYGFRPVAAISFTGFRLARTR
ncbi:hypothetical protein A1355_13475 [Methylomonas koyamae]|uniref:Sulfatase-modifying factor enzyme-like domain-containing protein n=1 Tax=Methylomonas koyamae TaxID=702114 RepID=A0A177N6M9_9GAMM|nr:hypothetical protein A1355_13475 [Methylomonas koyamae]